MSLELVLLVWACGSVPLALLFGAAIAHGNSRRAPSLPSLVRIDDHDLVYALPDGRSLRIRPAEPVAASD